LISASVAINVKGVTGENRNPFPALHYFKVVAHESNYPQTRTWESGVATASSVDNLAPAAPIQLTGDRAGNGSVFLSWTPGDAAPDFDYFQIYRSGAGGVTPTPPFLYTTTQDPSYVDPSAPGGAVHYLVTAVDIHGNESLPSNVAGVFSSTPVGDTPPIATLTLLPNRPNPFNASTDLEIGLPVDGDFSVQVYDVAGRLVRSMDVKGATAGWKHVPFGGRDDAGRPLASGVYFYRVTAAGETVTNKLVIAR
jgi:hypothetical protein